MDLLLECCLIPTTPLGSENFGETWFRETLGCCQLCSTSGKLIMHAWVDLCPACFGIESLCKIYECSSGNHQVLAKMQWQTEEMVKRQLEVI